ncbi:MULTISPECIES: M23 family metallopeptidase [Pseudanabaena]|uniref:M23 family metallopeptidase n=1 Tax=Pseudanabaena TaxID=1152 RepID=UPI002479E5F0|nr:MULTISPECIES: M23 family metallopeptidase [Pseudanabaena]WGS71455.1 M23 family metallopeptidase [Pseudanabaena galeata CCNP1313]
MWACSIWLTEQQRNAQYLEEKIAFQQRQEQLQVEQEQLQQEIDRLRERAGLVKIGTTNTQPTENSEMGIPKSAVNLQNNSQEQSNSRKGQGGSSSPDHLMRTNQRRLNSLWSQIRDLNPSLEATLNREETIPQGMPMQGKNLVITSLFGNRLNPFGYGTEAHNGIDFVDAYGSPVYATASGLVTSAGIEGGYGLVVVINHNYGYSTLYAHLSGVAVKPETLVKRGQLIGYLGNSGRSTGPHLHYSIYQGEKLIDPRQYLKLTDVEFQKLSNLKEP